MTDREQAEAARPRVAFGTDDRFEVEAELGRGGMGVVYRVFDRERRMAVALKTVHDADPMAIYQFKREFRSLADVSHPNLVALYELDVRGDELFFTMELVSGQSFLAYLGVTRRARVETPDPDDTAAASPRAKLVSSTELTTPTRDSIGVPGSPRGQDAAATLPIDEARLRPVLAQLAAGVVALHDAGYLHRDIKPSNVLVSEAGRVVLLDFGIVSELRPTAFGEDAPGAGTPLFMAPELLARTAPASAASDWYSVGVMLYRAFMGGALPRPGATPPRLAQLVPGVPADLDDLCARLLDPDPGRRPGDAEMRALGRAVAGPRDLLLVARAGELNTLRAALRETREGRAVVLRLHGASGMGKTSLARRFCDDATRDLDALVLAGRCYERESVPYKAIDSVIDELTRYLVSLPDEAASALLPFEMPRLARMFPVLRRLPALAELSDDEPALGLDPLEQQQRAYGALRGLLARLARARPLVLFIDDAQWGDLDSARLLDALIRPPGEPQLLVVLSHRSEAGGAFLAALSRRQTRLGHALRSLELRVDALEPGAARQLAAALLAGAGLPETAADQVAQESHGIPYFVHELVRFLAEDPGARLPALDQVINARVDALPEAARRLLDVVAVAGIPVSQRVALEAAQLEDGEALYRLRSARLVLAAGSGADDRVETYHDRIRETIVARLSAERRRERHRLLGERLEAAAGTDPEVLAGHFEAAGDIVRARRYALAAAALACAALAFERGADLYTKALAMTAADDPGRRDVQLALAEALVNAGRGQAAAGLYLAAAEGAPLDLRLRCQIGAADQLMCSGHVDEGLAVMQQLADAIGVRLPATPRRALVSLVGQRALLRLRGLGWKMRPAGSVPTAVLNRLDVYEAVAEGLGFVDNVRGADFQARFLLLSLRAGTPEHVARALGREAVYTSTAGPHAGKRAPELAARAEELAQQLGDARLHARNVLVSGMIQFFFGNFTAATTELARGEEVTQAAMGDTWDLDSTRYIAQLALRHLGRLDEVRRSFDVHVRDALRRGDRYVETTMRRTCNVVHLAADDPDEARRDLGNATWSPPSRGFHVQHWYAAWAEAELGLYLGHSSDALRSFPETWRGLERSFHTRIQTLRATALWTFGRLALASDVKDARAAWSARRLGGEGVAYARAWSLLLGAAMELGRGQREAAVGMLREAIDVAEREQLLLYAAAARRRLGQLVGGDEGVALVAQADAELRAQGVVNPERMVEVYAPGLGA